MTLRKDAMEILRVFNNNVVLAKGGDGGEVILTGRGLGFQAKPGQTVDESKVVRTFVPSDGRDPDHLAQMLADIPPEIIRVVVESMQEAGLGERETGSTTLVMALSDHVANAVERVRRGIRSYAIRVRSREVDWDYMRPGEQNLRQVRYLPRNIFEDVASLYLFDDTVAVMSALKENYSMSIESRELFTLLKTIWNCMWETAEE